MGEVQVLKDDGRDLPFMIGSSAVAVDGKMIITGGGATCFSMGTFWEPNSYILSLSEDHTARKISESRIDCMNLIHSPRVVGMVREQSSDADIQESSTLPSLVEIAHIKPQSSDEFEALLKANRPVVMTGLDLGKCTELWSPAYLAVAAGYNEEVRP